MKLMTRVVFCLLCLCLTDHAFGEQASATSVGWQSESTSPDKVLVASTRNYPAVEARVLDFSNFVGYTCGVNGDPCGLPVSLVEPGQFSSTWIFVHGNQIPPEEALKRGIAVYQRLRARMANSGPIRFVIWSWPSERTTNRLADAKIKAHRTDVESFYLASYVCAIANDRPVKFIGYSFGSRIVGGALHLASGGQLDGRCLGYACQPVAPFRIAMLAAAIENDGFQPSGRYCRGLDHVEHVLLMNNSRDQALRFYWILSSSKPKALGTTGFDCRPPHVSVHQYDWAGQIGKDHRLWQYLDRPAIVQRMVQALDQ